MEASVSDPRTGEIIKGHVSLGSLRIRQDFLIAQALQAPYANDDDKRSVCSWKWHWLELDNCLLMR